MIKYKNILDFIFYSCLMIYTQIKLLYIYLFRNIETIQMIDERCHLCKIHKIKYSNWRFHNNGYLYGIGTDLNYVSCLEYLNNKNIEISDFKIECGETVLDYQYKFITNYLNKTSVNVPFYLILDYYFKNQKMNIMSSDIKSITFETDCIDEYKISYDDSKYLTVNEIINQIIL